MDSMDSAKQSSVEMTRLAASLARRMADHYGSALGAVGDAYLAYGRILKDYSGGQSAPIDALQAGVNVAAREAQALGRVGVEALIEGSSMAWRLAGIRWLAPLDPKGRPHNAW